MKMLTLLKNNPFQMMEQKEAIGSAPVIGVSKCSFDHLISFPTPVSTSVPLACITWFVSLLFLSISSPNFSITVAENVYPVRNNSIPTVTCISASLIIPWLMCFMMWSAWAVATSSLSLQTCYVPLTVPHKDPRNPRLTPGFASSVWFCRSSVFISLLYFLFSPG